MCPRAPREQPHRSTPKGVRTQTQPRARVGTWPAHAPGPCSHRLPVLCAWLHPALARLAVSELTWAQAWQWGVWVQGERPPPWELQACKQGRRLSSPLLQPRCAHGHRSPAPHTAPLSVGAGQTERRMRSLGEEQTDRHDHADPGG
ncbi:histone-lysine N-methyltransferase SMYD1 [Platysternon megacephalum]|uniref:Histone-lysine N-methyltransferase SMYD1 n=1 Tax=Platysternon megacephalum TaxID=55544 RepID=A0A4D9DJX3_9SAUR|nr:histone-lysine N-methyltransferase SMYD1 [Platysternon megacephalum]